MRVRDTMTPPPRVNTKKPNQGVCWHMHMRVRDTITSSPRVNTKKPDQGVCWHMHVRVRDTVTSPPRVTRRNQTRVCVGICMCLYVIL